MFTHSPKIVTDGLVLCLDAGSPKSYGGSGTVWTDRSTQAQNLTLYNNPTFSSNYKGEILFSGSNDYARITNCTAVKQLSSNGTVELWFRTISSTLGITYARLISFSDAVGTGSNTGSTQGTNKDYSDYFCLVKNNTNESLAVWYKAGVNSTANVYAFGPSTLVNTNQYFSVVVSWETSGSNMIFRFFLNGVKTNESSFVMTGFSTNVETITIGQNCSGALTNPHENSTCAFSNIKLYNKALSQSEILQNFNALKGRYGL